MFFLRDNKQFHGIKVSGCDIFQGNGKDVIIVSALKPHDGFELLNDLESLIIALTRASDSLIFIGNFQYVRQCDSSINVSMIRVWKNFLDDAKHRKRFFDLDGRFDERIIKDGLLIRRNNRR